MRLWGDGDSRGWGDNGRGTGEGTRVTLELTRFLGADAEAGPGRGIGVLFCGQAVAQCELYYPGFGEEFSVGDVEVCGDGDGVFLEVEEFFVAVEEFVEGEGTGGASELFLAEFGFQGEQVFVHFVGHEVGGVFTFFDAALLEYLGAAGGFGLDEKA